jgi:hypothetical protein
LLETGRSFSCYQTVFDKLSSGILLIDFVDEITHIEENPSIFLYALVTAIYDKNMEIRGYVDAPTEGKPARIDGDRYWYPIRELAVHPKDIYHI